MNIYNKMTLIVILIATIAVSFTFYLFQKEDNPNKDALIIKHLKIKKTMGLLQTTISRSGSEKRFCKMVEMQLMRLLAYLMLWQSPNHIRLDLAVAVRRLHIMVKMEKFQKCMNIKHFPLMIIKKEIR